MSTAQQRLLVQAVDPADSSVVARCLENLQPARVRKGGVSKALPQETVEEKLEMVLRIRGKDGLNALRDQARKVAMALEWPAELGVLQRIADALLST